MRLYLVQHGEAVTKDVDPDRPLSQDGDDDVRRVARLLADAGVAPSRIAHSGKTRARQTAEHLADALGGALETGEGLGATDPVEPVIARLDDLGDGAMLVGHMPFMGNMAATLIRGDAERPVVAFQPGTVLALETDEAGHWLTAWMLRPSLAAA